MNVEKVFADNGSLDLPDIEKVLAEAEAAVGQCCIMHGAHIQYANIAGQKVRTIRNTFRDGFSISDQAIPLVKGKEVDENYVVKQGDTLEFAKQSGSKGLGKFYTKEQLMEFWGVSEEQYSMLLQMGLPKIMLEGSTLHPEVAVDEWFKSNVQQHHVFEELARPKVESLAEVKSESSMEDERLYSIENKLSEVQNLLQKNHQHAIVKEFYTVNEAAEKVGLAPWTIRNACNKKRISGAKKDPRSGKWRISHDSVKQIQNEGLPEC